MVDFSLSLPVPGIISFEALLRRVFLRRKKAYAVPFGFLAARMRRMGSA